MNETIDLTRDENSDDGGRKSDQTNHQEGQRKRHKSSSRPKSVYIVIHDKEPPSHARRGYGRTSFLPSRQDTEIISIHYKYSAAASAAVEYVMEEFEVYEDEGDEGNPLSHVDWRGKGWFREEEYEDVNVCNDRVRIEKHDVK